MSQRLEILKKQEEVLQFEHFNHEDAYSLGAFMVEHARKNHITVAVSIRLNNGCILFQHCPDGTNLLNQKWIERKFNSVKLMERSTLLSALIWERDGDTVHTHGLSSQDYALCGGGFPIRIKGSGIVVGAVIASNLFHIADHEFVVDCLREYLNQPSAPKFPYAIPE